MSGRYGKSVSIENQNVTICTMPELATVNIEIVNCSANPVIIKLAISETDTPSAADYIEHNVELPGSGVLIRSAEVLNENEKVIVHATNSDCSVRVHGITGSV
jgi:hypothetical protein